MYLALARVLLYTVIVYTLYTVKMKCMSLPHLAVLVIIEYTGIVKS